MKLLIVLRVIRFQKNASPVQNELLRAIRDLSAGFSDLSNSLSAGFADLKKGLAEVADSVKDLPRAIIAAQVDADMIDFASQKSMPDPHLIFTLNT